MASELDKYRSVPSYSSKSRSPSPSGSNPTLGIIAALLVWVPGIIMLVMVIYGNINYPCHTGLETSLTPFGCDTPYANEYRWNQTLPTVAFFLMIPVSIILGIIAIAKSLGSGWGFVALIPLPLYFVVNFFMYG